MAFTIHDADMAPSTAEASLAGATLAFSPTSAVPVGKLAVLLAVWDNTDGTNADDTSFLSVTDSKGNTWIRAGEAQRSAGVALDGLLAGEFYSVITTQIETTDTITVTHSSVLGAAKGLTLTAFNRDTAKGVEVAGKAYVRAAAATSYSVTVSGLTSEPHLWVGQNGIEGTPFDTNTRDTAYTEITQGAAAFWGAGTGGAGVGARGGYLISTGTTETYNASGLATLDRCTVLVAFRESVVPVAVGQASETDTARALVVSKVRTVGQASTTNVAQAIGRVKTFTVGQAVETDSAQTIVGVGSLLVGRASEVDSAGAVVASKALAVGRATESDQANPISPQRVYAVGQAVESDSSQVVSGVKVVSVGRAIEMDGGTTVTVIKVLAIGRAQESDSAGVITPIRCTQPDSTITVGTWTTQAMGLDLHTAIDETPASDADFIRGPIDLLAATHTCEVGLGNVTDPAVSTGHVVSYRYEKSAANEQVVDLIVRLVQGTTVIATWTHLAIANGWTAASQTLTGLEADAINDYTDLRLRFSQVTAVGLIARRARVSWAQFCVPIESGVVVQVGRATEADAAQTVARSKTLVIGPALEADQALAMVAAQVILILKALEADTARSITHQPIIGRAIETDSADLIFRQRNYEGVSTHSGRTGMSTQAERVGASTSVSRAGVSTYTGEE